MFFIEFFLQQQNNVNNQSLKTVYIPGLERESAKSVIGITEVLDFWREKQYGYGQITHSADGGNPEND